MKSVVLMKNIDEDDGQRRIIVYVMQPTYMHCFYPLKKSETVLKS